MDEILFHLTRRLESLQIWISEMVQRAAGQVETVMASSEQLQLARLKEVCHLYALGVYEAVVLAFNRASAEFPRPRILASKLASFVRPDLNRATLYAGCVGFTVGGGLGLVLGVCLQSPRQPVTLMKAVAATSFTGVDSIFVVEDAVPSVYRPDDVLIEVMCATIDPLDIRISLGYARQLRKQFNKYNPNYRAELPVILGRDGSGIVVEVGRGVTGLEVGDQVYFATPPWSPGTLAEYIVLPASLVARKPNKLGFEGAATMPYSGAVAWHAVVKTAGLTSKNAHKKRVLVHCGSAGVGWMVAQMCSTLGAEVTVTCLNRASAIMRHFGVASIVPLETGDVERSLLTRNKFDFVFNTAGPTAYEFCRSVCAHDGLVVSTVSRHLASDRFGIFLGALHSVWVRLVHGIFGVDYWSMVAINSKILDEVTNLTDRGRLQPVVDKVFSPDDIEKALKHIDSANAIGKTIIRFGPKSCQKSRDKSSDRPDLIS